MTIFNPRHLARQHRKPKARQAAPGSPLKQLSDAQHVKRKAQQQKKA